MAKGLLARDFVLVARLTGASRLPILRGHVLPAVRTSTWGNLLADSRQYLFNAPWMLAVPGCAIVPAVLAATLTGDGLGMRLRIPLRRRSL